MDEQEYLNQITEAGRPAGKPSTLKRILRSRFFIVGAIGLGLLIILLIIGSILNGGGTGSASVYSLKLHVDNTSEVIKYYQPNVRSSDLRSNSASLNGILVTTSRDLGNYLSGRYDPEKDNNSTKIQQQAAQSRGALTSELQRAKTNGILDGIYAQKMAREISLIMSEEAAILKSTGNAELEEILTSSYNSLNTLYSKFNDFSEAK